MPIRRAEPSRRRRLISVANLIRANKITMAIVRIMRVLDYCYLK